MKYVLLFLLLCVFSSCQLFEHKKVDAKTYFDNEIKTMDWDQIDTYPELKGCDAVIEKQESKACFEKALVAYVGNSITSRALKLKATFTLQDTVLVHFKISETANISVVNIQLDSVVKSHFPKMETWIVEGIDSVQLVAPAYKRGVPVKTKFTLPIVLHTEM